MARLTEARPDARATYRWSSLDRASVAPWADLVNHLGEVDRTEEFYEPADLAEELQHSGFDPARDSWAVWSGDRLVGYGAVHVGTHPDSEGQVRIHLEAGVHADHRGRGLGRELMARMERRGTELAARRHPGRAAYWRTGGGVEGASVRGLLEHRGYALVRYFTEMRLDLAGTTRAVPTDVVTPEGLRLLSPTAEWEVPVRRAHETAFADHWGSAPPGEEQWHDHWTARSGRADVSTLAVAPDGTVTGYVLCGQWVDRELYVNLVGTVPRWRGQGVARACLARTAALARGSGAYDVVELAVDSASPTGATRLYEAVGYRPVRRLAVYQRDATPA